MQHVSIRTFDNWSAVSYYFICSSRDLVECLVANQRLGGGGNERKREAFFNYSTRRLLR